MPHPTISWIGTALVTASVACSWFAFDSVIGRANSGFALFLGASAILLMAWSFVLALRPRFLEALFGGLDRMYRVQRWAGSIAVVAMFFHIRIEPEIKRGILGAGENLAESAEELAGVGEILLYVLIGVTLIRWVPYRLWRLTHKLLGVPYLFACFHFFTAEKPYANGSAWGWWFGVWMMVGTIAWLARVVVLDAALPGRRYRVVRADTTGTVTDLRLAPVDGRPFGQRIGQFAFVKLQLPGRREPHPFTIASHPADSELRFLVKDLGDWSGRLLTVDVAELTGAEVIVEGPYGRFRPHASTGHDLWVAGGVGITPFLAAVAGLPSSAPDIPTLVYCVRTRADAMALPELQAAAAAGLLRLSLHVSDEGTRLDPDRLADIAERPDLRGVHVAVCGPDPLVAAVVQTSRRLRAKAVHTEDFDIRQGFGPHLSKPIDTWVSGRLTARSNRT